MHLYYSQFLNHLSVNLPDGEHEDTYKKVTIEEAKVLLEEKDDMDNYVVWNSTPIMREGMDFDGEKLIHSQMLSKHYNS